MQRSCLFSPKSKWQQHQSRRKKWRGCWKLQWRNTLLPTVSVVVAVVVVCCCCVVVVLVVVLFSSSLFHCIFLCFFSHFFFQLLRPSVLWLCIVGESATEYWLITLQTLWRRWALPPLLSPFSQLLSPFLSACIPCFTLTSLSLTVCLFCRINFTAKLNTNSTLFYSTRALPLAPIFCMSWTATRSALLHIYSYWVKQLWSQHNRQAWQRVWRSRRESRSCNYGQVWFFFPLSLSSLLPSRCLTSVFVFFFAHTEEIDRMYNESSSLVPESTLSCEGWTQSSSSLSYSPISSCTIPKHN